MTSANRAGRSMVGVVLVLEEVELAGECVGRLDEFCSQLAVAFGISSYKLLPWLIPMLSS